MLEMEDVAEGSASAMLLSRSELFAGADVIEKLAGLTRRTFDGGSVAAGSWMPSEFSSLASAFSSAPDQAQNGQLRNRKYRLVCDYERVYGEQFLAKQSGGRFQKLRSRLYLMRVSMHYL